MKKWFLVLDNLKRSSLAGKKNHYNVKFLSGYGLSVSLRDTKFV